VTVAPNDPTLWLLPAIQLCGCSGRSSSTVAPDDPTLRSPLHTEPKPILRLQPKPTLRFPGCRISSTSQSYTLAALARFTRLLLSLDSLAGYARCHLSLSTLAVISSGKTCTNNLPDAEVCAVTIQHNLPGAEAGRQQPSGRRGLRRGLRRDNPT
jgi:hypothetical protein